jgi:hypothetical protein
MLVARLESDLSLAIAMGAVVTLFVFSVIQWALPK